MDLEWDPEDLDRDLEVLDRDQEYLDKDLDNQVEVEQEILVLYQLVLSFTVLVKNTTPPCPKLLLVWHQDLILVWLAVVAVRVTARMPLVTLTTAR